MTNEQEKEISAFHTFLSEARERVDRAVGSILASDPAEGDLEDTLDMADEGEADR